MRYTYVHRGLRCKTVDIILLSRPERPYIPSEYAEERIHKVSVTELHHPQSRGRFYIYHLHSQNILPTTD
jgi:hypothetical protein